MNSFETDILVPMSRIDLFFNEETGQYKFCEINTDGTSSMLEDKILNEALNLSVAYKKFIKDYNVTSFEYCIMIDLRIFITNQISRIF